MHNRRLDDLRRFALEASVVTTAVHQGITVVSFGAADYESIILKYVHAIVCVNDARTNIQVDVNDLSSFSERVEFSSSARSISVSSILDPDPV